tara:strand:- start:4 stop:408 length:405 start_codon:yes stop_codon:yes gene_type:complete
MNEKIISLTCGIIFGIGLVISGMTNPAKVISFLSITHNWDASLIFVMGGAIIVTAPMFYLLRNNENSLLGNEFSFPKKTEISFKLIFGSILFGVGWGLVGLCPGPSVSSIAVFNPLTLIFLLSMTLGILLNKYL